MAKALSRAIDRSAALRAIFKSPPALHLVRTVRASRAVSEPLRFIALQLVSERAAEHRLTGSGLRVHLRHRTRDVDIFKEVFDTGYGPGVYEPPAPVAAALDAKAAPTMLDLGANIGLFGLYALGRWPGARIHSFEPDPANLPLLRRAVLANQLEHRWRVAGVAVANQAGALPFLAGLFAESQLAAVAGTAARAPGAASLQDGETIMVPTVDLFEQDHDVDLLKIDIEGGEWSILTDPRLASLNANVIVLEWHTSGCPERDPRAAAARLLRAAGYSEQQEAHDLGHTGLVWAWRGGG
ncbi:MAG: FkbM family methyltransferase [Solirubrobacteraceae bacterium]|jgi:FkbM family methyltransferase